MMYIPNSALCDTLRIIITCGYCGHVQVICWMYYLKKEVAVVGWKKYIATSAESR